MLFPEARGQIQEHVARNCQTYRDIRVRLLRITDRLFSEIEQRRQANADSIEFAIVQLAKVNLELSNSIVQNIGVAQLLASHGLLRWQLVLWQKAFALCNKPDFFERWKSGAKILEKDLREFIAHFERPRGEEWTVDAAEIPAIDDDSGHFDVLSRMQHVNASELEHMVRLCASDNADETDFLRADLLYWMELRNTARFLLVAGAVHYHVVKPSFAAFEELDRELRSIDDELMALHESLHLRQERLRQS
jgi:hypothetical protein